MGQEHIFKARLVATGAVQESIIWLQPMFVVNHV